MREHDMSQQIKEIRKHYGLSQQAFARLLGIGEASITRYEKGIAPTKANARNAHCHPQTDKWSRIAHT